MIAEIAQYPDGTIVPLPISGTVKAAFDVKTGAGQYGPWSLQGFVLACQDGEIKVTISGGETLTPVQRGDQVELASRPNGKGVLSGVKKESYNGAPQLKVNDVNLRNLSRPAATQAQQYAQGGATFAASVPTATLQFPASAPAGAPTGSHMGPNPAPASFPASTPVPTQKAGILSEADARSLLLRQYRELGNAIGLWDAPGGADPAINAALMVWCTSLLIGVNQGKIEPQHDVTDAPSAQGRPDPW